MVIKYSVSDKAVAKADCKDVINIPDKDIIIKIESTEKITEFKGKLILRLKNNDSQYLIEEEPAGSRLFLLPNKLLGNRLDMQLVVINERLEPIRTWILEPLTIVRLEDELQAYLKIIPELENLSAKLESNESEIAILRQTIEELTESVKELRTTIYDPSV